MSNVVSVTDRIKPSDIRIPDYSLVLATYIDENGLGSQKMHVNTKTTTFLQSLEMFEASFPDKKIVGFICLD